MQKVKKKSADLHRLIDAYYDCLWLRLDLDLSCINGKIPSDCKWHFISLTIYFCASNCTKPFLTIFFFFLSQSQGALGECEDNPFQLHRGSDSHINAGVLAFEVWFCLFFGGRINFINYRIGGLGFCY